MQIVSALDVHRKQISYKTLDLETGEVKRGQIAPTTRPQVGAWLERFCGREAHFVLEATTGWRFLVEEIQARGHSVQLAEPAETRARQGRKRRAKTDAKDCDHMLELCLQGRVPQSWIPPRQILELRVRVRQRKTLLDQRREWQQRLQALLFHQGVRRGIRLSSAEGRAELEAADLSPAGRELVSCGLRMLEHLERELQPIERELRAFARRQPGCRALISQLYGVGPLTATAILSELGDTRRFSSSDDAVCHAGLDVTVWSSDQRRSPGQLSRQGPELLRWALYEAAQSASRPGSPDHAHYRQLKARLGHGRASLTIARKIARRAHHLLRELGEEALAAVDDVSLAPAA